MKKALVCYSHGLGDVIQLTPHLRTLFGNGYITDLMCRKEVVTSKLLSNCPYVSKIIDIPNPWQEPDFQQAIVEQFQRFGKLRTKYDWSGISPHLIQSTMSKIDTTTFELKMKPLEDKSLEVFISENAKDKAFKFINENNWLGGFIHVHTQIENHPAHSWDASEWIKENLHWEWPVFDTGFGGEHYKKFEDINVAFEVASRASNRVYSSSCFVHAMDSFDIPIDIINYGKPDSKVWPLDQSKVLHIRECGEMLR